MTNSCTTRTNAPRYQSWSVARSHYGRGATERPAVQNPGGEFWTVAHFPQNPLKTARPFLFRTASIIHDQPRRRPTLINWTLAIADKVVPSCRMLTSAKGSTDAPYGIHTTRIHHLQFVGDRIT